MKEPLSHRIKPYSSRVRMKRSGNFVSLYEKHNDLAWVTEPQLRTGPFRTGADFSGWEGTAFADFQVQPANPVFHLGSARSVHFGNHYLKGMGLTPLFPVREFDFYHGSGHLLPSAAAREYLVSVWTRRIGLASSIIPCEGLLVAEMPPQLAGIARSIYGNVTDSTNQGMPPCDGILQAISVKPSGFVRFTNFSWLLRSGADISLDALTRVLRDWGSSLDADFVRSPNGMDEEIGTIIGQIESRTVERLEEFFRFQTSGILWCSLNNNFTAGIKFLDLEVPLVTSPDLIFDFATGSSQDFASPAHFEIFQAVKQVREWIVDLLGWCKARELYYRQLKNPAHSDFLELIRVISHEIENRLILDSRIFNDTHWVAIIRNHYGSRIGDVATSALDALIDQQRIFRLTGSITLTESQQSNLVARAQYSLELGTTPTLMAPSWFPEARFTEEFNSGHHLLFAECIKQVELETRPEGFLNALRRAEAQINSALPSRSI